MTDRIILQTEPSADTALLAWDVVIAHAEKNVVQKTFDLYVEMGVLNNLKSIGCRHEGKVWELWGHFQDANGRRNGRIAQFDSVTDAVDFQEMVRQSIK